MEAIFFFGVHLVLTHGSSPVTSAFLMKWVVELSIDGVVAWSHVAATPSS